MIWTREDDRMLLGIFERLRQEADDTPRFEDVAKAMTEASGRPHTGDQVRNRLRRIREQSEAQDNARVSSVDELEWGDLESPEDGYVGFHIAFFDLETTNLGALMGRLLCASVTDCWGHISTRTTFDFEQDSPLDDRGVAVWIRDELEKYDIVVGWNSAQFDVSFLNARLLRWGERPLRSDLMHVDPMYKARAGKYSARVGSAKLDNVAKFFRTREQKTEIDWDTWQLAGMGDQAAMDQVVEHCEADVLVLRLVFQHLKPLIKSVHR